MNKPRDNLTVSRDPVRLRSANETGHDLPKGSGSLSALLCDQASAPYYGFDQFMVGAPARHRAHLVALLRGIAFGDTPSTLRVILGANGNGKTLINNSLREAATRINLVERDPTGFDVLFSRISVGDAAGTDLGLRLANELSRSIYEAPARTFTLISAKIFNDFAKEYKPPLLKRIFPFIARGLLRKLQKVYDDYARDVLDLGDADPVERTFDRIQDAIRGVLTNASMRSAFRRYAAEHELGSVLTQFLTTRGERALSHKALNEALREELVNSQRGLNPKDAIRTLAAVTAEAGCRALILMLDDCNSRFGQDYVLNLAESLGEFRRPKLLVIASGLSTRWEERMRQDGDDLSFKQKVYIFGRPLIVAPPTEEELQQLSDKLVALVNSEESTKGRFVDWDPADRAATLDRCSCESYRVATLQILTTMKEHVKDSS